MGQAITIGWASKLARVEVPGALEVLVNCLIQNKVRSSWMKCYVTKRHVGTIEVTSKGQCMCVCFCH